MKKGKTFESITRIIYESINNVGNAIIEENVRIKDQSGIYREIDILIRSNVFETEINIAIECKDHSRPVERSMIDSFFSKCNSIPEINKLIYVSKNGYQSGAIAGAKLHGIKLYNLSELDGNDILGWLGIISTQAYEMERRITKIGILFTRNPIHFEPDDVIMQNGQILEENLFQYVSNLIINEYPYDYLIVKSKDSEKRKIEIREFNFKPENISISRETTESKIAQIFGEITDSPIPQESQILFNNFGDSESEESQIISLVSERGDITSFIKKRRKQLKSFPKSKLPNLAEKR